MINTSDMIIELDFDVIIAISVTLFLPNSKST